MAKLTMDEGEYAQATIDLTGLEAPWDDITGATLTLYAHDKTTKTPMTPVTGVLDAPAADGKRHSGYALVPDTWPSSAYFCTLELEKAGDGYPQKQSFDLVIEPVALRPAT
jgi:hypothetical protein